MKLQTVPLLDNLKAQRGSSTEATRCRERPVSPNATSTSRRIRTSNADTTISGEEARTLRGFFPAKRKTWDVLLEPLPLVR